MEEPVNNEMVEQDLDQKTLEEIKAKVAELKKKNPKVKAIYPLIVEGAEFDDKELYIGYFRQPSFQAFSKYLSASQSNQAVAMRQLATDCFMAGDKELVDDDSLFLFGLMGQLSKVIEMRNGRLVNLFKAGK